MRSVETTVAAPDDLGSPVIGIPTGSDLELDLRLEAVMEGVLVSGTVRGRAVGECSRCLDEMAQDVVVRLQELFVYPSRRPGSDEEGEEDLRELEGDLIDLEPALRDAVVLALPFQPVCSPDCPGLCPQCGERLADDPGHQHDVSDPRWSALNDLFNEKEES